MYEVIRDVIRSKDFELRDILNKINTKYEKNCPSKIARAMNDQNLCVKR